MKEEIEWVSNKLRTNLIGFFILLSIIFTSIITLAWFSGKEFNIYVIIFWIFIFFIMVGAMWLRGGYRDYNSTVKVGFAEKGIYVDNKSIDVRIFVPWERMASVEIDNNLRCEQRNIIIKEKEGFQRMDMSDVDMKIMKRIENEIKMRKKQTPR